MIDYHRQLTSLLDRDFEIDIDGGDVYAREVRVGATFRLVEVSQTYVRFDSIGARSLNGKFTAGTDLYVPMTNLIVEAVQ